MRSTKYTIVLKLSAIRKLEGVKTRFFYFYIEIDWMEIEMGRRKGLNYVPLLVSITPEQMKRFEGEKNRSVLVRNLLDLYFEQWQPLKREYEEIVEAYSMRLRGEPDLLELADEIVDPEVAKPFYPPFIVDLKRLKELRQKIPAQLFSK